MCALLSAHFIFSTCDASDAAHRESPKSADVQNCRATGPVAQAGDAPALQFEAGLFAEEGEGTSFFRLAKCLFDA